MNEKFKKKVEELYDKIVTFINENQTKNLGNSCIEGKWVGCKNGNYELIHFLDHEIVTIDNYSVGEDCIKISKSKVVIEYKTKKNLITYATNNNLINQLSSDSITVIDRIEKYYFHKNKILSFIDRATEIIEKLEPYNSHKLEIRGILDKQSEYMIKAIKTITKNGHDVQKSSYSIRIFKDNTVNVYNQGSLICIYDRRNLNWYKNGYVTSDVEYIDNFLIAFTQIF